MNFVLSFLLRFLQATAGAAPYVICGLLLAGMLRLLLTPQRLQQSLNGDALSGPLRGWRLGLLLPVCSLGAIPVARELLRNEVNRQTVFAFVMAAPLFHPLTLAYALSVMDLPLLGVLLGGSLVVIAVAARFVSNDIAPVARQQSIIDVARVPYGWRRMVAIVIVATEYLRRPYLIELTLCLTSAGLVGAFLDASSIGSALEQKTVWAAPLACSLGTAIYMTPEQSISVLAGMFAHGNSLAAAFALLVCGAGMNPGTLLVVRNLFGTRALVSALTVMFVGVVGFGVLANSTVYNPEISATDDHAGHDALGHTHAFDAFARPAVFSTATVAVSELWRLLADSIEPAGLCGVVVVLLLIGLSRLIRINRIAKRIHDALAVGTQSQSSQSMINAPLSGTWLWTFSIVAAAVGVYVVSLVYAPGVDETFDEMRMIRAEVFSSIRSNERTQAQQHLQQWEKLTGRLSLGSFLRGTANGDQRMSAQILRQNIQTLRFSLDEEASTSIEPQLVACDSAYQQCKDVFAGKPLVLHDAADSDMPDKITDDAERTLYLTPGGIYNEADIDSNGRQTASERFAGFRSRHDMNPAVGAKICPVTLTLANPECVWFVNGKSYQFCCPPCVDEFVRLAKESPDQIKDPEDYVKR